MRIKIKGYIASKQSEPYKNCADAYAININLNRFAISDGVGKSFFPKIWSKILVENYVNKKIEGDFIKDFIEPCQIQCKEKIKQQVSKPDIKYYTLNAYNRNQPALATFVGLKINEANNTWSAQALGDSFLFFVNNENQALTYLSSKVEPIIFDNFPEYFSSVGDLHNGEIKSLSDLSLGNDCTFYLMTDALAEWFLNSYKEADISKISSLNQQSDFLQFIQDARDSEKLGNDDCALLIINCIDDGTGFFKYESVEISDLQELIDEQQQEKLVAIEKLGTNEKHSKNDIQEEIVNEHLEKDNIEIHKEELINKNKTLKKIDKDESIIETPNIEKSITDNECKLATGDENESQIIISKKNNSSINQLDSKKEKNDEFLSIKNTIKNSVNSVVSSAKNLFKPLVNPQKNETHLDSEQLEVMKENNSEEKIKVENEPNNDVEEIKEQVKPEKKNNPIDNISDKF